MTLGGFAIALIVGLVIGVLAGMLGIGGGVIMVPVFRLGFGMSALVSTATSLFTIIPTAIAGCITHIRQKTCIVPLGVIAGLGGAALSPLGVYLAQLSPSWAIMTAVAFVVAWAGITMFRKALRAPHSDGEEPRPSVLTKRELVAGLPIGMAAGLVAGYVGVGGGFIMTPLFLSVIGLSMKKASGTSLLAIAILALPAVIEQLIIGNVSIVTGVAVALGSIPGAIIGAKLLAYVSERKLRFCFSFLLVIVAVSLVSQELGLY